MCELLAFWATFSGFGLVCSTFGVQAILVPISDGSFDKLGRPLKGVGVSLQ